MKEIRKLFCLTILVFFAMLFFSNVSYAGIKVGGSALLGDIYGIVLDADTGEPIEGVKVSPKVKKPKAGKTDKNGRFHVTGRVGSIIQKLTLGIPTPFSGAVKMKTSFSLPWEDIKFSVSKPGYDMFIGNVPRYYHRFSRGWGAAKVYVYTIYLAKIGSQKNSEYAKDFFDKNFIFSDISIEPQIITKGDKIFVKCKFTMPPEETLTIKPQVRDLITGKTTELKKEIDKTTKKETGYYTAEVKAGGKPGLYPIGLQSAGIAVGGSKWYSTDLLTVHKSSLQTFTKNKEKKYIIRCKTREQEESAPLFFSTLEKIQKEDISGAEEDISQALSKASDFAPYHWAQSLVYQEKGEYLKAIDSCKKSLEIDKNFLPAYLQLGLLYSTQMASASSKKDIQKKVEVSLDTVAKKAYKDAEFYKQIAEAYFIAELYDKAKKMYEKAFNMDKEDNDAETWKEISENKAKVTKNPKDAGAWYKVGSAYVDISLYDRAIEDFKKAVETNPKYHEAYNNLGETYIEKNLNDEAIDAFKKAIELSPKQAEYHFNLAQALKEKGTDEEALKEFDEALKIKPKEEEYKFEREFCQARINVAKSQDDAAANIEAAQYYFEDYDYDNVIKHCEKAITLGTNSADAYGYLGLAYAILGKQDEAQNFLEKGKSLNANNSKIRAGLATIYEDGGDYAKAKSEWEEVMKLEKGKKSTLEKTAKEHLDELKKMK